MNMKRKNIPSNTNEPSAKWLNTLLGALGLAAIFTLSACGGGGGSSSGSSVSSSSSSSSVASQSATNIWTWVGGSSTVNRTATYGTLGVAAAANTPSGRSGAITWSDNAGNLWLFGGYTTDAAGNALLYNDLWKYNSNTNTWTWVNGTSTTNTAGIYGTQGVASSTNIPGPRESSVAWMDASGKLWLFGGAGYDSTGTEYELNDLWVYDPSTNMWTWVSGSNIGSALGTYGTQGVAATTNIPSARDSAAYWLDSNGNVWVFGGYGIYTNSSPAELNDLWMYNPTANTWTWVGGSNTAGALGVYGTMGTAAASNIPGARDTSAHWIDNSGNLWLFGGEGYITVGNVTPLNDLWMYNTKTNQWTWVNGSNAASASGVYGTALTAATSNTPGARIASAHWVDKAGKLWLFGGYGIDSTGATGGLNDTWVYDTSKQQWAWMSGSNQISAIGVYATQGTATGNTLSARTSAQAWKDNLGNLWLMGGYGFDSTGTVGPLNDVWKYTP